jgi:hypothetical protein
MDVVGRDDFRLCELGVSLSWPYTTARGILNRYSFGLQPTDIEFDLGQHRSGQHAAITNGRGTSTVAIRSV